ncbi:hypothetical protein [Nonomuraea sediminis]|nr:hypothetical protein [Nonomuraea sediminis]
MRTVMAVCFGGYPQMRFALVDCTFMAQRTYETAEAAIRAATERYRGR